MRSLDQQPRQKLIWVNNSAGSDVDFSWTNPSGGLYDIRGAPGVRIIAATPIPNGATASQGYANSFTTTAPENPSRAQVGFLNSTGGVGSFGGFVLLTYRKNA